MGRAERHAVFQHLQPRSTRLLVRVTIDDVVRQAHGIRPPVDRGYFRQRAQDLRWRGAVDRALAHPLPALIALGRRPHGKRPLRLDHRVSLIERLLQFLDLFRVGTGLADVLALQRLVGYRDVSRVVVESVDTWNSERGGANDATEGHGLGDLR